MPRHELRWMRMGLGLVAGFMLWLIWQASTTTSPELESIRFRYMLSNLFFGTSYPDTADGITPDTYTTVSNWRGLLPLSILIGLLFATLKPLPRFLTWLIITTLSAFAALYCFHAFKLIVPWGGPLILLNCAYLCGTLIYLETEKIERGRNLAVDLQLQAEKERKRIAKDLHDESLPSLSKVMRLTDQLQSAGEIPAEIRSRLESCITEMRRVINDLHPAMLEEFGLATSLEHLCEQFGRDSGIKTSFCQVGGELSLSPFHELCLYRIAQEAMNNIDKHAEAKHADITLEKTDNALFMRIVDDGNGNVRKRAGSYGLHNIAQRAKLIDAEVAWKAPESFASGTALIVKVPARSLATRYDESTKLGAEAHPV